MNHQTTNETPAKEKAPERLPDAACSDFWTCVGRSVEAIAGSLPLVPHGNGYVRIELATQLKRLVDIMERASMPMLKLDSQNEQSPSVGDIEKP